MGLMFFFFFSSRRRHTRCSRDWSSDVCSSDLWRQRNDILRLTRAHQYGDILLAIHRITDRRGIDAGADIEGPQLLEGFRVVSAEAAIHVAEENQISRSGEQAGIVRIGEFQCCP